MREWLNPKVLVPLLLGLMAMRSADRADRGTQQVAQSVAVMSVDQGREASEMDSLRREVRQLRDLVLSSGESGRRGGARAASPTRQAERRPIDYALAPLKALGDAAGAAGRWLFGG